MRLLTWIVRGARHTFARTRGNVEIAEELEFHMASRVDDLVSRGMTRPQAERQARLEFGSRDKAADECREASRFTFFEDFARDCRHSVRSLRKHPGLIAISVVSLALGIGVNTLLFGAVRAVFLSMPTAANPDGIVWVEPAGASQLAYLNLQDLEREGGFASLAGFRQLPLALRRDRDSSKTSAESVSGMAVTPNYFRTLGVTPIVGRDLADGRDTSAIREAVISYGFWKRRFGRELSVLGSALIINGQSYELVGVLPEHYTPLVRLLEPDLYVPLAESVLPGINSRDDGNALTMVGRLHADQGMSRAVAAVNAFDATRTDADMQARQRARPARLRPLGPLTTADTPLAVRLFPVILAMLCGLVLLIGTANVAGLLLARALTQRHELALLSALGASRRRIMQRILADSLMLSIGGAAVGLLIALWLMPMLQELSLPGIGVVKVGMQADGRFAAYSGVLMLVSGLLCGLVPAISSTRRDPAQLLRSGVVPGITGRLRLRQSLVIIETAATVVLLVAAFLFARTLVRQTLVDTGLDLDRGVVSSIELRPGMSRAPETMASTERLLDTLRSAPGVEAAGVAEVIPLTMDFSSARFAKDGEAEATARGMINSVGPGYFHAIGMRLLAGRDFSANDRVGGAPVVVVNERFASMNFEGGQAVGHRLRTGRGEWAEIVGIVTNNSLHNAGEDPPYPQVFLSWAQRPVSSQQRAVNLVVRSSGSPDNLVRPVQALAMTLEPDAPTRTRTLRDATAFEMSIRRAAVRLLTTLGALGLLLAAIGLYGIVSYLVASQTTELGVRMALGASAPMVLREVLWRGVRLTLWGLAAGLVFSLAGARLMASLLVGLSPADPVSFVGTAVLLLVMGIAASYIPARRATRTDPMVVLRQS